MNNKLSERVETLVFLSKDMLSIEELAKFFEVNNDEMKEIVLKLKEDRKETGINIKIENNIVSKKIF